MRTTLTHPKPTRRSFQYVNPRNFLHLIFTLLILAPTLIICCLDLTATISRSSPIPILRGRLVDNSKFVCGINLSTAFGSRLPWNCLPGFKAYSSPDGGQLVYTNEGEVKFDLRDIKKSLRADPTGGNQLTVLRGRWFGCSLADFWTPSPKLARSRIWTERHPTTADETFSTPMAEPDTMSISELEPTEALKA